MKKLLLGVLIVVVVVIAGAFYMASRADHLLRTAVIRFGPEVLGAPVSLGDVRISLRRGRAGLSDLVIGNPPGFASKNAMRLARIDVQLDIGSLFSDEVVIDEITIVEPELTIEMNQQGSNLSAIGEHVEAAAPATAETGEETAEEGPRLVIARLDITGGKVHLITDFGGQRETTVSLPDIHLENLGREGAGITPQETAEKIFGALSEATARVVAKAGLQGLMEQSISPEDMENVGAMTGDLEAKARKKAKKALKKLKGLLKNN